MRYLLVTMLLLANAVQLNGAQAINESLPYSLSEEALDSRPPDDPSLLGGVSATDPDDESSLSEGIASADSDGRAEDSQNGFTLFLQAKTCEASKKLEKALDLYQQCAKLQRDGEEVFFSLFKIALIKEALQHPYEEVEQAYLQAYNYSPLRVEPLFKLAHYQRKMGDKESGFVTISRAVGLKRPEKIDPSVDWIYNYGLLLEYSLSAFEADQLEQAYLSSLLLLSLSTLPQNLKELVSDKIDVIKERLHKTTLATFQSSQTLPSLIEPIDYAWELDTPRSNFFGPSSGLLASNESPPFLNQRRSTAVIASTVINPSNLACEASPSSTQEPLCYVSSSSNSELVSDQELLCDASSSSNSEPTSAQELLCNASSSSIQESAYSSDPLYGMDSLCMPAPQYYGYTFPSAPLAMQPAYAPCYNSWDFYRQRDYNYGWDSCYNNSCYSSDSPIKGRIYTLNAFGKGLGNIHTYQSVGLLLAAQKGCFKPFVQLQELNFCKDQWAANFGIGVRYFNCCTQSIFGINAFYDYRNLYSKCSQLGLGFEMLGNYCDLYVNGYFPTSSRKQSGRSHRFDYPGGFFAIGTPFVGTLRGFDAEVGVNTKQWLCCNSPFNLYLGAGGYHYKGKKPFSSSFGGVRYRAELSYYDFIYAGFIGNYDCVNHSNVQGYLALSLPFDQCGFLFCESLSSWCSCWYDNRMTRPVQRNPAIFATNSCCDWKTNY